MPDPVNILFDCQFEGTFADSVNGILPTSIGDGIELESSTRMFGSGCCKQTGFSTEPETLFSDGVTLSNAQSAIHLPHHYGPISFDYDAMTLSWGNEATPVSITGDGTYTLAYNDDPTETIDATVDVSELPGAFESHDPVYLEGTYLVYTPTAELITALNVNGFTASMFQQNNQAYTPPVGDTIPANTTYHTALVFEKVTGGHNFYMFVQGILQAPTQLVPDLYTDTMIAFAFRPLLCFSWLDSFQVIEGALWTENFTSPSSGFGEGEEETVIETDPCSDETYAGFVAHGEIVTKPGTLTRRGFCYVEGDAIPTIADSVENEDGDFPAGEYSLTISGLPPDKFYNVCAFLQSGVDIDYAATTTTGHTLALIVSVMACTLATINSVTANGKISTQSTLTTLRRGFCYMAGTGDPTTSDTVVDEDGDFEPGEYSLSITGLSTATLYSLRAFLEDGNSNIYYSETITLRTQSASSGEDEEGTIPSDSVRHCPACGEVFIEDPVMLTGENCCPKCGSNMSDRE